MMWKLLLLFLQTLLLAPSISSLRNLSDIHYRFTTCGSTGRNGPPFSWCMNEYTRSNSPIVRPNNLLFDFGERSYLGAQGFRVPKSGLYNITVAGAAGGRGICSLDGGKGLVWRGQVDLSEEQNLLILVGQKGVGPCDINPSIPACTNPPILENETASCFTQQWAKWITEMPKFNTPGDYNINYSGGGGGGGASMIRIQNRTSGILEDLPTVIAGGGGGSSVNLSYDIVLNSTFGVTVPAELVNAPSIEIYYNLINAKSSSQDEILVDSGDYPLFGVRGYINFGASEVLRGGAGGGWSTAAAAANADGEFLNVEQNFAQGGFDCGRQFGGITVVNVEALFDNLNGGFGGGGGQCGGGGAGGGYTGGSIFGTNVNLPGGGGFSYFSSPPIVNVTDISMTSDDHGYVDIVLSNCGCANFCVIVEDMFRCDCPNDTNLAPDTFDCYRGILQEVDEGSSLMVSNDDIVLTPLYFNRSFSLYGAAATLQDGVIAVEHGSGASGMGIDYYTLVDHIHSNLESCVLFFLGGNGDIVLASNVVREHHGVANMLAEVSRTNEVSEYQSFLDSPVLVSGALLATYLGGCAVRDDMVELLISTVQPNTDALTEETVLQRIQNGTYNDVLETMFKSRTVTTVVVPIHHYYIKVIVPLGLALVVVVGLIFTILVCMCVYLKRKRSTSIKRKGKNNDSMIRPLHRNSQHSNTSSTSSNSTCTKHWAHTPVYHVNAQYDETSPRYIPNDDNSIQNHGYESISYSDYDGPDATPVTASRISKIQRSPGQRGTTITESARLFNTQYGISAPIHDFTSYNKTRITDSFDSDWEYPRSKLIYLRELGEGQFGKVLLMRAQGIANFPQPLPVAVKTLSSRNPALLQKFMEEAQLMRKCAHPNIVSLLGVSSHNVSEDSAPLMILEYMPYGDLQSFLESHRPEEGKEESAFIGPAHFFSFARDIVEALQFLETVKHVHRDVAARNCLVGPGLQVKLADFGMARGVYDKSYYRVEGSAVLPVRWLAPESLLFGVFTTASDVWSYGVLLWEIVTYGKTPLPGLETEEIIQQAETGDLLHSRPENCPEDIYTVMSKCHSYTPEERITFSEIVVAFSKHNIDDIFEGSVQV